MPNTTAVRTAQVGAAPFFAGKNKIINGDFGVNQRNFTSTTTDATFGFDRFPLLYSGGTCTYSAQTFTLGAAPVAGYEGKNFARLVSTSQTTAGHFCATSQKIEDVRTFAGQTVTYSFWAKASTGTPNIGVAMQQNFGSGGSPSSEVITSPAVQAITSSWARYSFTVSVPSISGKTIGTTANTSYLGAWIFTSAGTTISGLGYPAVGLQNVTIDIWGVQLEAGSTATSFQTATGTIQGELAACQRYYSFNVAGGGISTSTTGGVASVAAPVTMRVAPTVTLVNGTGAAAEYTIAYRNITSIVAAEKVDTSGAMAITYNASAFTNTFRFVGTLGNTFSFSSEL
jgi:hypothetical protein